MQSGDEAFRGVEMMIFTKLRYFQPQGGHGHTRKVYPVFLKYNMDNIISFIDSDIPKVHFL